MRAHIVLAHPEGGSFNSTLAGISQQSLAHLGWETSLSNLYAMGFDPCEGPVHYRNRSSANVFHAQTEQRFNSENNTLPPVVEAEVQHLLASDLLLVHFPLWWFGMPAILKGWMDRVFAYARMYRSIERYDKGICKGKKVLVCVTTGASEDSCSFNGREGDTLLHLWPTLFPFRYLGFDVLQPQIFHGVGGVAFIENNEDGLNTIDVYLEQWKHILDTLDSRPHVPYNSDDDFDHSKRLKPDAPDYSPFIRQAKE